MGIFEGIFVNSLYDIIKLVINEMINEEDEEYTKIIYSYVNKTLKIIKKKYNSKYKKKCIMYLEKSHNMKVLVDSIINFNQKTLSIDCFNNLSFTDSDTEVSMNHFIKIFNELAMESTKLSRVYKLKEHLIETKTIKNEVSQTLVEVGKISKQVSKISESHKMKRVDQNEETYELQETKNILFSENKNFVGREELISQIKSCFDKDESLNKIQIITGMGGIGKTQLVSTYAYTHYNEYRNIYWIKAEEHLSLILDYIRILPNTENENLRNVSQDKIEILLSKTKKWLEKVNYKSLLIFDNVEKSSIVQGLIPNSKFIDIIITSQDPNWNNLGPVHNLMPLDIEISTQFLIKRTRQSNTEGARSLAKLLNGLPLALEQAGAYIEQAQCPYNDYIELFNSNRKNMLDLGQPSNYKYTLSTTWLIAFKKLKCEMQLAVDLLNEIAMLDADGIPLDILGYKENKFEINKAILLLKRYSLIERTGYNIITHRLLQIVVRENIPTDDKIKYINKIAYNLHMNSNFDNYQEYNWERINLINNNIIKLYENTKEINKIPEIMFDLVFHTLNFLNITGFFHTHFELTSKLGYDISDVLGDKCMKFAQVHLHKGISLYELSRFQDALESFDICFNIFKRELAEDDPKILGVLNYKALTLCDLCEHQKANEVFEKVEKIIKGKEDKYDKGFLAAFNNNYSLNLIELGEMKKAKQKLEYAIKFSKEAFGENSYYLARDINNLGYYYERNFKYVKAREYYIDSLEMYRKIIKHDNHPRIAKAMSNIGNTLKYIGNKYKNENNETKAYECYNEAMEYYTRSHEIDLNFFGKENPIVARHLVNIGNLYSSLGNYEKAEECLKDALMIDENWYGEKHKEVAMDKQNLSTLYTYNKPGRALRYMKDAIRIYKSVYSPNNTIFIIPYANLGTIYLELTNYKEAIEAYRECLRIAKLNNINQNVDILMIENLYADLVKKHL